MLFSKWSQYSAYLFGYWLADGHISLRMKHGKLRKFFGIGSTDKQIIVDLTTYLGRNYWTTHPTKSNRKTYYSFEFRDDETFDFCLEQIGTINKSSDPINFPFVPFEFLHHQIRGYFDGDGSLYWAKYRNRHGNCGAQLRSSFTAGLKTGELLIDLRDKLTSTLGLYRKKLTGKAHKKLVYSQYDTMNLCNWMYMDATIYLERKKEIWDGADRLKLERSIKYHHTNS